MKGPEICYFTLLYFTLLYFTNFTLPYLTLSGDKLGALRGDLEDSKRSVQRFRHGNNYRILGQPDSVIALNFRHGGAHFEMIQSPYLVINQSSKHAVTQTKQQGSPPLLHGKVEGFNGQMIHCYDV